MEPLLCLQCKYFDSPICVHQKDQCMQSMIKWTMSFDSEVIFFFDENSERANELCSNCINYYPEWPWQWQ